MRLGVGGGVEGNLPRGYCGSEEAFGQERLVKVSRGKKKKRKMSSRSPDSDLIFGEITPF